MQLGATPPRQPAGTPPTWPEVHASQPYGFGCDGLCGKQPQANTPLHHLPWTTSHSAAVRLWSSGISVFSVRGLNPFNIHSKSHAQTLFADFPPLPWRSLVSDVSHGPSISRWMIKRQHGPSAGTAFQPLDYWLAIFAGWWFQIFFIFNNFTSIWWRFPFWLIFFKGVETTD